MPTSPKRRCIAARDQAAPQPTVEARLPPPAASAPPDPALAELAALRREAEHCATVLDQCRAALAAMEAQIAQCEALLDQTLLAIARLTRKLRPDTRSRLGVESAELSMRELEVLQLVAHGLSNRAIAERLVVAEGTVKNHLGSICRKLEVRGRWQAVAEARRRGLMIAPRP